MSAICAAKKLGVQNIIAVDLLQSRIDLAKSLGAITEVLSSPDALETAGLDFPPAIKKVTSEELGCTHILDTSPSVAILSACMEALQHNGTVLQVGVKPVGAKLELDTLTHMVQGRRLVGVIEGDRDAVEALPELVHWVKEGILPVDKMLVHYPEAKFERARDRWRRKK